MVKIVEIGAGVQIKELAGNQSVEENQWQHWANELAISHAIYSHCEGICFLGVGVFTSS